jgi:tripartite-type tricarboxylate transporter receptor subunit TctC
LATVANTINATLYDNLKFNIVRDLVPVAGLAKNVPVMLVNPSFPAKTFPEFIASAKAHPGRINIGIPGIGSSFHMAGELLKVRSGINLNDVPYRGAAQMYPDLLGDRVQVAFDAISSAIEQIRAGKIRALAVTAAMRSSLLPQVPAVGEFIPGYETVGWIGIAVPKNTPAAIVNRLSQEIAVGLADATIKARFSDLGAEPLPLASTEFAKLVSAETEKWSEVIKFTGAKPE